MVDFLSYFISNMKVRYTYIFDIRSLTLSGYIRTHSLGVLLKIYEKQNINKQTFHIKGITKQEKQCNVTNQVMMVALCILLFCNLKL